jgi:hypothetical protein
MNSRAPLIRSILARLRPANRQRCHRAMFAVDIAAFGNRPAHLQILLRKVLYDIVPDACDAAGLPWKDCHHEDRGDGMFVIARSDADIDILLNPLAAQISHALRQHNNTANDTARIQVRMAIHAGYIQRDAHGITGPDLNHLFRLLEAPALKTTLTAHSCGLALIVSGYLFDIATTYDLINPDEYEPTTVNLKETNATAWTRIPSPSPPTRQRPSNSRRPQTHT